MILDEMIFENLYESPSRNGLYKTKEFHGRGTKIVNMGELFGLDFISNQDMKRLELTENELKRFQLIDGDLLFGRRSLVESGAGKCSLVDNLKEPLVFESSIIRVRLDSSLVNPKFYFYYFSSHRGRSKIMAIVSGVNVKGIRGSDLKKIRVDVPTLETQNKIASILSAYDDLIENNQRRIALLEESARLLYREWFVKLRFPGHEDTKIVDGVPEGWKRGTIGQIARLRSGYAFKSKDWLEQGNPVIKIKNIDNGSIDLNGCQCISDSISDKAKSYLLETGYLVIAMTGATVGKVGIMPRTEKNHYLNQRVGEFIPNNDVDCTPFLYTFFRTEEAQKQVLNYAGGAAQPNISGKQLEGLQVLLPDRYILKEYVKFCFPLFENRLVLIDQNQKLKAARDLLLPKLMNGDIPV
jgi:type I restriction enzyme, S subunit